jgi:hypothetical protein
MPLSEFFEAARILVMPVNPGFTLISLLVSMQAYFSMSSGFSFPLQLFSYILPVGIMRKISSNNNPAIAKHNHPEEIMC